MQKLLELEATAPKVTKKRMLREDSTYMSESRDLFVWTVDKDEDMQFCERNKVKVLITNTPSRARDVLGYH